MRSMLLAVLVLAVAEPALAQGLAALLPHQPGGVPGHAQPLRTRYPVILAHGIMGFRAIQIGGVNVGNYFRGVEPYLRERGLTFACTNVGLTNAVEQRARLLKAQIDFFFPGQMVNIIAHSLGGLDARQMLTQEGMGSRVASLTTVGTPHRGTWCADWAVKYVGHGMGVEKLLARLGVPVDAFSNLRTAWCAEFNRRTPDVPGVRYFSHGGQQPWYEITPPFVPFHWLMKIKEKTLAGRDLDPVQIAYLSTTDWGRDLLRFHRLERDRVALAGVDPADVAAWNANHGANDGVVPMRSTPWGESHEVIPMDHLDQIGWLTTVETPQLYEGIVRGLIAMGL